MNHYVTLAVPVVMFAAKLVDAAFVLLLIDVTAEATCEFVFVFTPAIEAPSEVEAKSVCALTAVVPAEIFAANEDEAFKTFAFVVLIFVLAVASEAPRLVEARSVWAFTAVVTPEVCVLVFELIAV